MVTPGENRAMTTTTDSAGRSDLGQNDRLVGLVRLVIGLAQGIALYLLVRASEGEGATWSSRFPETFGPLVLVALFLPPPLLAGVGRLRWPTLAIWGVVAAAVKRKRFTEAVRVVEEGIEELEAFYRDNEREDLLENSGEISSLRFWLEEVRQRKPLTQLEKLQRALDEAISVEDYERAAKVRDQMRKLQASDS